MGRWGGGEEGSVIKFDLPRTPKVLSQSGLNLRASTLKNFHSDLEHSNLVESLNLKSATKTPLQYMEMPPKPCLMNLQILKLSSEVEGRLTRGVSSIHELMKKMGVLLNRTTTLPKLSYLPISSKFATSINISCPLPMAERVITSIGTSSHAKGNQTSFCCCLNPTSRGSSAADKEFDFFFAVILVWFELFFCES